MEITYTAKDGKVFNNEYDYKLYEDIIRVNPYIRGLDADLNVVPFSNPDFMEDIEIIIIENEDAFQVFDERREGENREFSGIDSPGVYMTDYLVPNVDVESYNLWFSMDEAIETIEEFIDEEYEKIKEMEKSIAEIQRIRELLN